MSLLARSYMTTSADSLTTGHQVATKMCEALGSPPKLVMTYLTVNHDQPSYLQGMREVVGRAVPMLGCSAQGVIGPARVREEGFAAGALALGGQGIAAAHARVTEIAQDTQEKGRLLGQRLRERLPHAPKLVILHYDPLCRVDIEVLLDALFEQVECDIVGGGSSHAFFYEELRSTYQYFDQDVTSGAAVACAISGQFGVRIGASHGCSPVGVQFTVTRAKENVLLELNGRPAIDIWYDICGSELRDSTALAIGLPTGDSANQGEYRVRGAYALDKDTGGVVLGCTIPEGSRIMLHHRSTEHVLDGTRQMGAELREKLRDKTVRAALGFECGSRTRPFLGDKATLEENLQLQRSIGAEAAWLGMTAWGEVFPIAGRPSFHNYSYAVVVLSD
ncbi:MAG: FIST C-terminal domain-containing protein [Polyangiaceae bacterium]|nr:FIST C-terminal domain-containing protein [Polyangiaceae bacterium]